MKKPKRLLVSLICMLLVAAMVGCTNSAPVSGTTSEPAKSAEPAAPAAQSDQRVTITYAQWGNDTETAATKAVAEKFNASQDRITVEVMQIDHESYIPKLNAMATANQLPDTAIMSEAGALTFAINNQLLDISEMYEANEAKPLDSITFKYKGKPVAYSAANEVLNLWYNIDLLKEVTGKQNLDISKFTPPADAKDAWDWDTFVDIAKTLTLDVNGKNAHDPAFDKNNIAVYGVSINTLAWQLETWTLSNGGGYYAADGSKITINENAATEALQRIADLYLVHHVSPQPSSSTTALSTSLGSEKVVMATDGQWNVGTYLGPDANFEYGVGVLPYMKEKVTICTGGPNVVFSSTKHPKEAMEWLKWYAQEENAWDLIQAGTWMPTLESWYTEDAKISKWIENPNFPDRDMYKSAVVDYAREHSRSTSWYYVSATDVFNSVLDTALSYIWTGDMTAQQAIDKYMPELEDAFTGGGN